MQLVLIPLKKSKNITAPSIISNIRIQEVAHVLKQNIHTEEFTAVSVKVLIFFTLVPARNSTNCTSNLASEVHSITGLLFKTSELSVQPHNWDI